MQAAWNHWPGRCRMIAISRVKTISFRSIDHCLVRLTSTGSQFSTHISCRPTFHLHRNWFDAIRLAAPRRPQIATASRLYTGKGRSADVDPRGCQNIPEVLQLTADNIDGLSPSNTAAVWSFLSRMLTTRQQRPEMEKAALLAAQGEIYQKQISAILSHTADSVDRFNPKHLATITLAMAKIIRSIRQAHQRKRANIYQLAFGRVFQDNNSNSIRTNFRALSRAVDEKVAEFDSRSLSNLAYALALMRNDPNFDDKNTLLKKIGYSAVYCIRQFKPQALSNTVWAYATLRVPHPLLFESVGNTVARMPNLNEFKPQELSNIANVEHPELFRKIGDSIVELDNLQLFKPQNLSNTVWAYATLGVPHPLLFQSVGNTVARMPNLNEFKPQELSNIVWAFAKANVKHPGLFEKIGDSIVASNIWQSFKPQELSNTVWAFATADMSHPPLFKKIGDCFVASDNLNSFKPQNLSNIVWAYAKSNVEHPVLFRKIGDSIVASDNLKLFKPQGFSNTVWAYATLGVSHPLLFESVGNTVARMPDLNEFKPQDLSSIVWAYAKANAKHPELFGKIGDSIVASDNLKLFKPQDFSNIVWAYAKPNVKHPVLLEKIGDSIVASGILKFFDSQALANIAWSYVVANVSSPLLFSESFSVALLNKQNEFSLEDLRQLHQWHLWQAGEQSNIGLPESLQKRCQQAFIKNNPKFSYLEENVLSVLDDMGLSPINEYLTQSNYRLDALVDINGKKVGVEVNGPYHFID